MVNIYGKNLFTESPLYVYRIFMVNVDINIFMVFDFKTWYESKKNMAHPVESDQDHPVSQILPKNGYFS